MAMSLAPARSVALSAAKQYSGFSGWATPGRSPRSTAPVAHCLFSSLAGEQPPESGLLLLVRVVTVLRHFWCCYCLLAFQVCCLL